MKSTNLLLGKTQRREKGPVCLNVSKPTLFIFTKPARATATRKALKVSRKMHAMQCMRLSPSLPLNIRKRGFTYSAMV
jgi:hypothetical protein